MRYVGFVLGMVGVLASVFAAIVVKMVSGITDHTMALVYVSAWVAVALGVAGSVFIWWRPRWAGLGFAVAAVWILVAVHYVALPAAILWVAAAVVAWVDQRKKTQLQREP